MRTHHQPQLVGFVVLATFQCINGYDQKCNWKYVIIAVINKPIVVVVINIFCIKIGVNYGEIYWLIVKKYDIKLEC